MKTADVREWSEEFSVNVKLFDVQHGRFVQMIARLEAAMSQGTAAQELADLLADLIAYAREHFATEEAVMKAYDYPLRDHHALEHRQVSAVLDRLHSRCRSSEAVLSVEVLDHLRQWLEQHVAGTDKMYTEHLNARGLY
ncbi:MAG TPA: bacteriohemerythrin [Bryobacteraceae bacterium]|nr:bacteriohemerythrin [Bryobacteraceae bacterium]